MAGYKPLYIKKYETGLVQNRQEFILPNDAYPTLVNAFVWRERIKRKQGFQLLGRLRRVFTDESVGTTMASPWTFSIFSSVTPAIAEPNAEIEVGSVVITIGALIFTDQGDGTLTCPTAGNSGVINYETSSVTLTHTAGVGVATTATFNYFPSLPVMGLRTRETTNINNEPTIAFDQTYAYKFSSGWEEFIPGTTWTGADYNFFWSTNYWIDPTTKTKLMWVMNNVDPIRYTDGNTWTDFTPTINATAGTLENAMLMLPFRGRLVVFNTTEKDTPISTDQTYTNRIRWAAIGSPFTANAWRDDIRGQGGFLDIPTNEDIMAVGFVRDNLVIYCERSTWQLRYTGRSIAPFQIEKVNSELGSESPFSAVQFDTSLVGVGDKGLVQCDSFKSDRIDIKIPDLVYSFQNDHHGVYRVHGIRDFQQRLAFWIYPLAATNSTYPNRRLVYNYENDSWAIFTDSLTCLGNFQPTSSRRWSDYPYTGLPNSPNSWQNQNYSWANRPSQFPAIVGGNQQGYVLYLDEQVSNSISQTINDITGNTTGDPIIIESVDHNLENGQIIEISSIVANDPFVALNGQVGQVDVINSDTFYLFKYNSADEEFSLPVTADPGTYLGGGQLIIRDNFNIVSKKFNFLEEGQNIQLGYIDLLMDDTEEGEISLNIYQNYNNNQPINKYPQNATKDTFFNSVIPTTTQKQFLSKSFRRVYCASRGAFLTLEFTLNNEQMTTAAQSSNVQIDNQVLWIRKAGTQLPQGV
jgi:hypothetical protein